MNLYNYHITLFVLTTFLLFSIPLKAQIIVDGDLKEWGDTKNMRYDNENNLYYSFKKDNQFLYLAILKNKYPFKFHIAGVQIFFAEKKADTTGLQLLFANNFKDPVSQKNQLYSHDFFTVKNLNNVASQNLTTYNETGILIEWKVTDIRYKVIVNETIDDRATPPNPNVFTAEIQIPLQYLQKYSLNQTLHFGIACRCSGYKLPAFTISQLLQTYQNPKNDFQKERLDEFTPTSFFRTVDLKNCAKS